MIEREGNYFDEEDRCDMINSCRNTTVDRRQRQTLDSGAHESKIETKGKKRTIDTIFFFVRVHGGTYEYAIKKQAQTLTEQKQSKTIVQ